MKNIEDMEYEIRIKNKMLKLLDCTIELLANPEHLPADELYVRAFYTSDQLSELSDYSHAYAAWNTTKNLCIECLMKLTGCDLFYCVVLYDKDCEMHLCGDIVTVDGKKYYTDSSARKLDGALLVEQTYCREISFPGATEEDIKVDRYDDFRVTEPDYLRAIRYMIDNPIED